MCLNTILTIGQLFNIRSSMRHFYTIPRNLFSKLLQQKHYYSSFWESFHSFFDIKMLLNQKLVDEFYAK